MFSSKPMNCGLILDKYISGWNDEYIDDIKKWTKRLKSSIDYDNSSHNKHQRACLSNINSLIQLLDIYSEIPLTVNMDDVSQFINSIEHKKVIGDIEEFRAEIISIIGYIDKHDLRLEFHLREIILTIDELSENRKSIHQTADSLNIGLTELNTLTEEFKAEFPEQVKKCHCKHDDPNKIMEAWQELHQQLKQNNRSHVSCRKKINQYLTLLDQLKSEKLVESELVSQMNKLCETNYKNVLNEIRRQTEIAAQGKLTPCTINKILKITPGRKLVYKADIVTAIQSVFNECFINMNKFIYSQEF